MATRMSRLANRLAPLLLSTILCVNSCGRASSMDTVHTSTFPADRAALAAQIDDLGGQHVHMPALPTDWPLDRYINAMPSSLRDSLKGKVVLLDIWDYTCVNCIRTLPYIQEWNKRYKDHGLVVIGVHAPEFDFEKAPGNLDSAVKRFGLTYPIIADNDYQVWSSLANQYWPAKYLFDQNGILRAEHFGEGEYQAFEAFLQKVLHERDSTIELPDPVKPVRETDKPGAVCYRATPETYIGFSRSHIGNDEGDQPNLAYAYHAPADIERDRLYLDGGWNVHSEYASPTTEGESSLQINYQAKEVNLVLHPIDGKPVRVYLEQDGKPLPKEDWGSDVEQEGTRSYIEVNSARMYNLVNNSHFSRYRLTVTPATTDVAAYAFTFTSACQPE
jgi:thiol-disulfide isomerase/thioredoxin